MADGLVTWVDLWPTVSLISWIGTQLLLMIDAAVCLPLWCCAVRIDAHAATFTIELLPAASVGAAQHGGR